MLCLLLLLGGSLTAVAQQIPLYTQYNINPYAINPAYAGSVAAHEFKASFRSQWTSFPTAPTTAMFSYTAGFKRAGFGVLAFQDEAGSFIRNGFLGSYAYHMPLFKTYKLGIGISMKYLQYRLNTADIEDEMLLDNAIMSAVNGRGSVDGTLGIYFYDKDLYAGFSAPNLIQTKFDKEGVSDSNLSDITKHYFALVGYKIGLDLIMIEPSVLVRKVQAAPFQIEGNLKVWFAEKQLMLGTSYRTSEKTFVGMFGVQMDVVQFYYSYEFSRNNFVAAAYANSSHELTLGLELKKKENSAFKILKVE